jgi:glycosyltransferase involved in cell wall biosynthesis
MYGKKILFSATDTRPSLQHAARALHDAGLLGAYYTTFGLAANGSLIQMAEALDRIFGLRFAKELKRRAVHEFPAEMVHTFPWWDIPRTLLGRLNTDERIVTALNHRGLDHFDRHVAAHLRGYSAVYAVNSSARSTFMAAKRMGIFCIYGMRILETRSYAAIMREELAKYPSLFIGDERNFAQRNRKQTEKQQAEWDLADLVITNSNLTRDTHAAYGYDVSKVRVVPLGFPPVSQEEPFSSPTGGPLDVLWAGSFSIRKGAHYLLAALKSPMLRGRIRVRVFGKQLLPQKALVDLTDILELKPTIPRAQLFDEYRRADILVLPTLSDGFAMVISEAMSQGLPVITTDCAGVSQFIVSGKNGLIVPARDADALADALTWCADHRDEVRMMSIKARETAAAWQWPDYRKALLHAVSGTVSKTA